MADLMSKANALQEFLDGCRETISNIQAGVDLYGRPADQEMLMMAYQDMPALQGLVRHTESMINDIQIEIQHTQDLIDLEMSARSRN